MANTNATVNSAIIAQTALTTLLAKFPLLARIATDFSAASVKYNQDIITHIVTPTVAREFNQAIGLTGITITKLDGTARGGVLFGIAHELGLPIRFIGVGEAAKDLRPFDAGSFVNAISSAWVMAWHIVIDCVSRSARSGSSPARISVE